MDNAVKALFFFGKMIKADIVSDNHFEIIKLAKRHGGAAKPSGAGGGDVAVCFIPETNIVNFKKKALERGFPFVDISISNNGVTVFSH